MPPETVGERWPFDWQPAREAVASARRTTVPAALQADDMASRTVSRGAATKTFMVISFLEFESREVRRVGRRGSRRRHRGSGRRSHAAPPSGRPAWVMRIGFVGGLRLTFGQ